MRARAGHRAASHVLPTSHVLSHRLWRRTTMHSHAGVGTGLVPG